MLGSLVAGILLWIAGTVIFDTVHWILHGMLRSRWGLIRALAWPHAVHHQWIDQSLQVVWETQRRNVVCHIVPEFLTQLAFSGVLWLLLPTGPVLVCVALQTLTFAYILSQQGLDVNHRPVDWLDAYAPSFLCPPAYHALHHVHPDAYFSAYTKLVDGVVGGAAWLEGRRYGLVDAETPLGRALGAELGRIVGADLVAVDGAALRDSRPCDPGSGRELDVLLLCAPRADEASLLEPFLAATRHRQLPPEVWAVHERADDPTARHYFRDVRVSYRTLLAPRARALDDAEARRAARTALFSLRHGLHVVPTRLGRDFLRERRRFLATRAVRPEGAPRVRSRAELAPAAG